MPPIYFVGVDVGTGSARAALVTSHGHLVRVHTRDINIWNPAPDHYEQSSDDIWEAVCECVKEVVSGISPEHVVGISFAATCSLVVLGPGGHPLSVSSTGRPEQNVILWMDHRAYNEAAEINASQHELLKFVGGNVSLEMEMPKLLWLKNNLYVSCWSKIWRAFDLPDYLTWKATNRNTRSLCSVVCKWNYDACGNCWSNDFLEKIGLGDLCESDFEIIGKTILSPGSPIGNGLTEAAASQLGLFPRTCVGSSLIDAHAGALALLGCNVDNINSDVVSKLALISGTSSCHMSLTREPCWAKGIWGPYKNAILPGMFLNEGGQSCTGKLLDYILSTHPYYSTLQEKLRTRNPYAYLNEVLENIAYENKIKDTFSLTKDIHVWPDFHGNRSPIADPNLKGMISGLTMKAGEEELAVLFLATLQSLAYGTRHIIESLTEYERSMFSSLLICGGLSKNPLYVQTHADVCNIPVILPKEDEMVLVGAAMLGACASKVYPSLEDASREMGGTGTVINPNPNATEYHNKKYKVFLKMLDDQRTYEALME